MSTYYRIQDAAGRGPFKPGFSSQWVRDMPDVSLVPWLFEIGPVHETALIGEHCACVCETIEQLKRWFNPHEYRMLLAYGYHAVKVNGGRVLGRSKTQAVIARSAPLTIDTEAFDLYDQ